MYQTLCIQYTYTIARAVVVKLRSVNPFDLVAKTIQMRSLQHLTLEAKTSSVSFKVAKAQARWKVLESGVEEGRTRTFELKINTGSKNIFSLLQSSRGSGLVERFQIKWGQAKRIGQRDPQPNFQNGFTTLCRLLVKTRVLTHLEQKHHPGFTD